MACNSTRLRALSLYKELHRLGRDYPDPSSVFHISTERAYSQSRLLTTGTISMAGCASYSRVQSIFHFTIINSMFISTIENRNLTDKDDIENALKLGEYIKKGAVPT